MKKLLTLLLSIAMIMVMMPSMAWAAESTTVKTAEELTNAVNSEDAIVLGADITASITIKNGKNVTLDLGGYTLTNTDKQHTITVENGAELRIVGQGTVDNVSHGLDSF